ncbi:hypothetical protein EDD86DRAFT_216586 [Gorgonomyces haynaldii]|nr:hypothetical protein EDD86DRAFT_216586 [Gorgonomyces haynaldii]
MADTNYFNISPTGNPFTENSLPVPEGFLPVPSKLARKNSEKAHKSEPDLSVSNGSNTSSFSRASDSKPAPQPIVSPRPRRMSVNFTEAEPTIQHYSPKRPSITVKASADVLSDRRRSSTSDAVRANFLALVAASSGSPEQARLPDSVVVEMPESRADLNQDQYSDSVNSKSVEAFAQRMRQPPLPVDKQPSSSSMSSSNDTSHGRPIVDSLWIKAKAIKFTILGITLTIAGMVALSAMHTQNGMFVSFLANLWRLNPGIFIQMYMAVIHVVTMLSIQEGISILIGYLLASKRGYNFIAVLYCHCSFSEKMILPSSLSYRSSCRQLLGWLSLMTFFQQLLVILSPFSAATASAKEVRSDKGALSCAEYHQDGVLFDRGYPTTFTAFGVSEYVFGTSLGVLRSENDVSYSSVVFPPQLVDTLDDGSTIFGAGFITNVSSSCQCSASLDNAALTTSGYLPSELTQVSNLITGLNQKQGIVSAFRFDTTTNSTTAVSLMYNFFGCGGFNKTTYPMAICTTTFSKHQKALVTGKYMTDGTPASIAIASVSVREVLGDADNSWIYQALVNFFGGSITATELPATYPGSVNPMLWWMTSNMQGISSASLGAGMETFFAIAMRGAIQRSYSYTSTLCGHNIVMANMIYISVTDSGYALGITFLALECLICLISLCMAVLWLISTRPIFPSIRITRDIVYYHMMVCEPADKGILPFLPPSSLTVEGWPLLDVNLKFGESIKSAEDPDVGTIALDKPKMVTYFQRGKLYK